jgi:hypothetical protein
MFSMSVENMAGTSAVPVAKGHIVVAVGASIGGLLVHNLIEFPPSILLAPETWVPVAITILLGLAMLRWPSPGVFAVMAGWAVIIIVIGGASVLPLSIWSFTPDQTVTHYTAHLIYALAQLPLLWVAWRGFRAERRTN